MSFIWGDGGEKVAPDASARRRKVAEAMIAKGTDFSPVQHWSQSAARVAQAMLGGLETMRLDEADKKAKAENDTLLASLLGGGGGAPAAPSATPASGGTTPAGGGAFPASLIQNESGGRWDAKNDAVGSGGKVGHFGRLQFGQARLQDAMAAGAIPAGTTPEQFMADPELQKRAEQWHFADIDQNIKASGFDRMVGQQIGGVPLTIDGMRAVAHLGGSGGLKKFIETGGKYNPADANGTRLSDYLARHGGATIAQADAPAQGATEAQFVMPPGQNGVVDALAAPSAAPSGPAGNVAQALAGNRGRIVAALSSPYASETTKKVALAMLAKQMEGEKPQLTSVAPGSAVIDARTGRVVYRADPKDERPTEVREFEYGQRNPEFAKRQMELKRAGATSVNLGGGSDKQIFDAMHSSAESARAAVTGLNSIRQARAAVQGGGIFGAGADARLGLAKIGAMFGADPTKIVNTETFRSAIAPQVASLMKATVGSTQISNADREFAEKAAGGSINLDEKSITRLLDIMERGSMAVLEGHTSKLNAVYPDGQNFGRERSLFGVQTPEAPAAPGGPQPGQVENGYRFKGGNPADPSAWEKVQ